MIAGISKPSTRQPFTPPPIQPGGPLRSARPAARPSFGNGSGGVLSAIFRTQATQTILEDIFGFGLLRTGLDLFREYFYRQSPTRKRELNIPAARERIIREVSCIFSANFLAGSIAWLVAKSLQVRQPNAFHQFISHDTQALFKQIAANSSNETQFMDKLSHAIAKKPDSGVLGAIQRSAAAVEKADAASVFEQSALEIAQKLGKETLDWSHTVGNETKSFALDTLVGDSAKFLNVLRKQPGQAGFQSQALAVLNRTSGMRRWLLPLTIGTAMAATAIAPHLNNHLTQVLDGIKSYPGTIGLTRSIQVDAVKDKRESWSQRMFPYLTSSAKQGNYWPILISLIPLPFALGLVNNPMLAAGQFKKALNLPGKNFLKNLGDMFQFRQGFPFTTFQQIASLCALVCTARVATCRDKIEMRERLVDAYGSWALWIVGIPLVKKWAAKKIDLHYGTRLLKDGGFRREIEIKMLDKIKDAKLRDNTLRAYKYLGTTTFFTTLALLGLVEPLIAIKWTEWQVTQSKNRAGSVAAKI